MLKHLHAKPGDRLTLGDEYRTRIRARTLNLSPLIGVALLTQLEGVAP